MANAKFYVGNFAIISIILIMLGSMGMANDIYGDDFKVYDTGQDEEDPGGNSFDIDRIRYSPDLVDPLGTVEQDPLTEEDEITRDSIEEIGPTRFTWDGTLNEQDDEVGVLQVDVEDRTDVYTVSYFEEGSWGFSGSVGAVMVDSEENTENIQFSTFASRESGTQELDFSGQEYGFDNVEVVEFYVSSEDSWFDTSGNVDDVSGWTETFDALNNFIINSYRYITEVPSMVAGYIAFTLAVPGTLGTFLRLYIGGLFFVFIVLELWIG